MKKVIIVLVVLFLLGVGALMFVGRTYYPDNIAETSLDGGKKGLKTRFYEKSVPEVSEIAANEIKSLSSWGSSWKLVDQTDINGAKKIKVEIPVVVFTDDLTVSIKKEDGKTRVDVASQSRVGKSDFGENERNVRKLLVALDQKLK